VGKKDKDGKDGQNNHFENALDVGKIDGQRLSCRSLREPKNFELGRQEEREGTLRAQPIKL